MPDPVALSPYLRWKVLLDVALGTVLLALFLPILGALIVLVRLTSRGPGLYRQSRVGKDGRRFRLYKIRTMRRDAEETTGAVWAHPGDPRITRLGRILRKFHLDELPQLFNVLRGEMSLVGPRPERPEFVQVLSAAIPGYGNRLKVRPGITGLAQLNLPPDTDLCCVCRKVVLDMDYLQHAGLFLDLRVLCCTLGRIFKLPNFLALRPLRLMRSVWMEECRVGSDHGHDGNGSNGNGSNGNGDSTVKAGGEPCPAVARLKEAMGKLDVAVSIGMPGSSQDVVFKHSVAWERLFHKTSDGDRHHKPR